MANILIGGLTRVQPKLILPLVEKGEMTQESGDVTAPKDVTAHVPCEVRFAAKLQKT